VGVPDQKEEQKSFSPTSEGLKWMPDVVPAKVTIAGKGESAKGSIHFATQAVVNAQDISFRPTGKTEPRELKFSLAPPELPMKLPSAPKVVFDAPGNYVVLPSHAIYPIFGFAVKKRDVEISNALEQVLGKTNPKGVMVYTWSDKKVELISYDDPTMSKVQYRGTVILTENVPDVRDRLNAILLGYYWSTLAKFTSSDADREQLKSLASTLVPKEAVDQYLLGK